MLAPHVAQANAPAKLGRESRAGDVAGFFSGSVSGNEQLCPRHGRLAVEKLQTRKPAVCMPARTDSLHDFLARIAAFFVIDVGEFKARFVRNILVVVILSKPRSPELQAKLARVAAENNSVAEEYVRQLVEQYLDHDAWFRQRVKKGLSQLDQKEFVTHEEIGARIDQMFRS